MSLRAALQARWAGLASREKGLAGLIAALMLAALLWWLALAPALSTLRSSEARHQVLDAQLQQMQNLRAQALALQSQPKLGFDEALRALEASIRQRLGAAAQLSVAGERVTVTLRAVPAETLAQWLVQARLVARARPTEARLVRSAAAPAGAGANPAALGLAAWDGSLVLGLPAR